MEGTASAAKRVGKSAAKPVASTDYRLSEDVGLPMCFFFLGAMG